MCNLQVHENTALLKDFRDNIMSILGRMETMGGVMREMPVLPVALNTELARSFRGDSGAGRGMSGLGSLYRNNEGFPIYPPIMDDGGYGSGGGDSHMGVGQRTASDDLFPDQGIQSEDPELGVPVDAVMDQKPFNPSLVDAPGLSAVAPAAAGLVTAQPASSVAADPAVACAPPSSATQSPPPVPAAASSLMATEAPSTSASDLHMAAFAQLPLPVAVTPWHPPPGGSQLPTASPAAERFSAADLSATWQPFHGGGGGASMPNSRLGSMADIAAFLADGVSGDSGYLADGLLNDGPTVSSGGFLPSYFLAPPTAQLGLVTSEWAGSPSAAPSQDVGASIGVPVKEEATELVRSNPHTHAETLSEPGVAEEGGTASHAMPSATRSVPVLVKKEFNDSKDTFVDHHVGGAAVMVMAGTMGGALGKRDPDTAARTSPPPGKKGVDSTSRPEGFQH